MNKKIYKILNKNLLERHLRGGNATRLKYLKLAKDNNVDRVEIE